MAESIPVKDIEAAEAIAEKLIELGVGWPSVEYVSSFKPVEKGIVRKKRKAECTRRTIRVRVLPDAKNIKEYKEIRNKLRTIARTWQKKPSYDGEWLYLESEIGNVTVSIGISFPKDRIVSIMSELLKCEITENIEQRPAYTAVSYVCKRKETTPR